MADVFFDYDACTVDALNRALDERLRAQAAEIERLRAVIERVYQSSNQPHIIEMTRAALEGK